MLFSYAFLREGEIVPFILRAEPFLLRVLCMLKLLVLFRFHFSLLLQLYFIESFFRIFLSYTSVLSVVVVGRGYLR